jgi:hypothetical protein
MKFQDYTTSRAVTKPVTRRTVENLWMAGEFPVDGSTAETIFDILP